MSYNIGKKNGRYIDGRCKATHYCPDCGIVIASRGRRCKVCGQKYRARRMKGENNPNYRGGRFKSGKYIMAYSTRHKKYIYEHRLVMETFLNRKLRPEEVVHHENGNKFDNRLSNLRLFNNNGEHIAYHANAKRTGGALL